MPTARTYGQPPYRVALVHGGPGAAGEMAPLARALADTHGVLEPIQTAATLDGQVAELRAALEAHADGPVVLVGFSWGAWLSALLAAAHPMLVARLVLVGSGPFEHRYAGRIQAARLSRLEPDERQAYRDLVRRLNDAEATVDEDAFARLGALATQTDQYDPLPDASWAEDAVDVPRAALDRLLHEGLELRRSGQLLKRAAEIQCPVIAIHGAHDPHPTAGVAEPLADVLGDFRLVELPRCGHKPWIERQARDAFDRALRDALRGG